MEQQQVNKRFTRAASEGRRHVGTFLVGGMSLIAAFLMVGLPLARHADRQVEAGTEWRVSIPVPFLAKHPAQLEKEDEAITPQPN